MTSIIEPAHTCCDHGYPRPPRGNRVHNFDGLETRLFLFVFAKEKTEIYNFYHSKKIIRGTRYFSAADAGILEAKTNQACGILALAVFKTGIVFSIVYSNSSPGGRFFKQALVSTDSFVPAGLSVFRLASS